MQARTDVPEPRQRPGGHQEGRHDEHAHACDGPEYKHSLWPPAETIWIAKLCSNQKISSAAQVFELLEVVQFRCPYTSMKYPQLLSNLRVESKIEEILRNSATSEFGSVYYFSEKDYYVLQVASFDVQMSQELHTQLSESEKGELKESFHHTLKWAWRYNKNLEEQAAQLHMLTSWSKIVEVAVSRSFVILIHETFDVILCDCNRNLQCRANIVNKPRTCKGEEAKAY